jgi:hypothetical protein
MIHAYIVGKQFMHKTFSSMEAAIESVKGLHTVPHIEKIMWVFSERELTPKEELMLNVVQQEME